MSFNDIRENKNSRENFPIYSTCVCRHALETARLYFVSPATISIWQAMY